MRGITARYVYVLVHCVVCMYKYTAVGVLTPFGTPRWQPKQWLVVSVLSTIEAYRSSASAPKNGWGSHRALAERLLVLRLGQNDVYHPPIVRLPSLRSSILSSVSPSEAPRGVNSSCLSRRLLSLENNCVEFRTSTFFLHTYRTVGSSAID